MPWATVRQAVLRSSTLQGFCALQTATSFDLDELIHCCGGEAARIEIRSNFRCGRVCISTPRALPQGRREPEPSQTKSSPYIHYLSPPFTVGSSLPLSSSSAEAWTWLTALSSARMAHM